MPYVGLPSFLPMSNIFRCDMNGGVNALCRATFISTIVRKRKIQFYRLCVNALCRATFISTNLRGKGGAGMKTVSMPYVGLPSFLLQTSS